MEHGASWSGERCREGGTGCSLRSLPSQTVLWFYDFKYCWLEELMKLVLKQAGGLESRGGPINGAEF